MKETDRKAAKERRQKLNVYDLQDVMDILYGDSSIELKYETVAVYAGWIVSLITVINNLIFYTSRYMVIHSIFIFFGIPIIFLIVGRITPDPNGYKARRVMAVVGPPIIALVWIISGGYKSVAGIVWMIYMVAFNSLATSGKKSRWYAIYAALVNIIVLVFCYTHPDNLIPLDRPEAMDWQNLMSVLLICLFIYTTVKVQRKIAEEERKRLIEKEEELTAVYEEVVASNAELQGANEKLEELNRQVENQMDTQTKFTASMNHELRSPLNGIIGNMQILKLKDNLTLDEKVCVESAMASGRLMLQTVNDLLDFAKLREGKFDIVKGSFDLRSVYENVKSSFEPQAGAKGLEFDINIEEGTCCRLEGDDVRIEQILNNLVSNAVKYTDKGKVTVRLGHTVIRSLDALRLYVSDTGQGMSSNDIDAITQPYTRFNLEKNKSIQGTGLGMSIVKSLVEQMEGTLSCETKLNEGTAFTVLIPARIIDPEDKYTDVKVNEAVKSTGDAEDFTGRRFLCVDDTLINQNVFKGLLKKSGAYVKTVSSGEEALELVGQESFDIIFLDHMMPKMDGIETFHKMKEIIPAEGTDYVMLTGNTGNDYRKMYREEGFSYVLDKPILKDKLVGMIEEILAKRK